MSIGTMKIHEEPESTSKSAAARQLDAISWALFLIWIGFAVLAQVGWGWALLGIGVIILGAQSILWERGEKVERFSVACGLVFLAGAVWELFGLTWPLAPVLLILVGLAMLWNATFRASAR